MVKFIHAADLHLDTPFSGLEQTSKELAEKLRAAPFESLAKIVDRALTEKVDFMLLAGDLYNTQRVNIKAQSLFIEQLDRLDESDIPVFLIRGNHDYLTAESKTLSLPFPKNVYTYSEKVQTHVREMKGGERVAVTGFSYDSQWIFDRKIAEYPKRRQDVDLHIGLLHGSLEGLETKEGNYAPFSSSELRAKNYDYWALGHIHKREKISERPLAYYAGNIQGLHKNEPGEKGGLLVEWTPRDYQVEFISTAPMIWDALTVEMTDVKNVSELFEAIRTEIEAKDYPQDVLLHLTLRAKEDYNEKIVDFVQRAEFSEHLSKQLKLDHVWFASVSLQLEESTDTQTLEKLYPETWEKVLQQTETTETFHELTEQIFDQIPSKYLNQTTEAEYRREMIEKAIAKIQLK